MKTESPKRSVIIVDDEPLSRRGLIDLLDEVGAYVVNGAVGTLAEAKALWPNMPAGVLILDIAQHERSCLAFLEECRKLRTTGQTSGRGKAGPAVLVWSNREDYGVVRDAFKAGALGYVSKRDGEADLLKGREEALAGQRHMGPRIKHRFLNGVATEKDRMGAKSLVSPREWEVFCLLVRMDTAKQIAEALGLSQKTVETHLRRMRTKLRKGSLRELIRFAIQELEEPGGDS